MKDGQLVGFCCLFLNDDEQFGSLVDNLHVAAAFRKLGIGKLLLTDASKTICNKTSSHKMYLWVCESNSNARLGYENLGAKI